MPSKYHRFFALITLVILFVGCNSHSGESLIESKLGTTWEFKNQSESEWHKATVPGNIYSELFKIFKNGDEVLSDTAQLYEMFRTTWEYRTNFDLTEELLNKDSISVCFPDLPLNASIYLNDTLLNVTNTLFYPYYISCKRSLKAEENRLRIVFNAIDQLKYKICGYPYLKSGLQPDSGFKNNFGEISGIFGKERILNKRIPGINTEPTIIAWSKVKINDVYFYPLAISDEEAQYNAELNILSTVTSEFDLEILLDKKPVIKLNDLKLKKGKNRQSVSFTIQNPRYWWVNGLGSQHLYKVSFRIKSDKQLMHEITYPLGVVKFNFNYDSDSINQKLRIKINDKPIFLKGVILDLPWLIRPDEVESFYIGLINDLKTANINVVRLLHADFIQSGLFYKLCNEKGILVWQDLPVPGNSFSNEEYLNSVLPGIMHLRNLSCKAVYLGRLDNYNQDCYSYNMVLPCKNEKSCFLIKKLPDLIKKYDHKTFYWAYFDADKCPRDMNISEYNLNDCVKKSLGFDNISAFQSVSFPGNLISDKDPMDKRIKLLYQQMKTSDLYKFSTNPVLKYKISLAKDLNSISFISQTIQADQTKRFVEDSRLNNQLCLGIINVPFNDSEPYVIGNIRDFGGNLKPVYYVLTDLFEKVLLINNKTGDYINVYAINDELKGIDAILLCRVIDFSGKDIFVKQIPVTINGSSKKLLLSVSEKELLKSLHPSKAVMLLQLNQPGRNAAHSSYFFTDWWNLDLPEADFKVDVNPVAQGYNVILRSNVFAANVFLQTNKADTRFSVNFFNVIPNKRYKVHVYYNGTHEELIKNLKIYSLNNCLKSIQ